MESNTSSHMPRVAAAVDALAAEGLQGRDAETLAEDLRALQRQLSRLQAEFVRRLAAFDATGAAAQITGAASTTTQSWLRRELRQAPGAATTLLTAAKRLPALTEVADAFAAGDIHLGHVRVITRTATDWRLDAVQQVESILVEAARRLHPAQLGQCAARIRVAADPDQALTEHARADRQRRVSTSVFDGSLFIDAVIPMAAGGEEIMTALNALEQPDSADTPIPRRRSRPARLADALVDLARIALDGRAVPQVGGERPHLSITIRTQHPHHPASAPEQDHAELRWGGPIPIHIAQRLACDAQITRTITDFHGNPIAIDQTVRAIPHWLRKLLVLRDRRCRGPDCNSPPEWCEGHHITFWSDGGPHELANLILLCRRCHMLVHDHHWTVKLLPDATAVWTDPTGRTGETTPDPTAPYVQQAIAELHTEA